MTKKEVRELLVVCDGCGKAMLKYTGAFCSYCTPLPQIQFLKKKLRKEG